MVKNTNQNNSVATGGFPPLYVCEKKKIKKEEEEEYKNRGFTIDEINTVASLKDIMSERRNDDKGFISL